MTPIRANIVGPPSVATRIKASIAGPVRERSRWRVGTVSDEPKLLGILHFAQRDHHSVSVYRVVFGEKKVHAIGQHVDDARAAPLAAAKYVPKLIAFDFLHSILRPLAQ
jgi:hypothetical protein